MKSEKEKSIKTISSFKGKNSFLSNFYPCVVRWHNHDFPSLEHAYQAAKAKFAFDYETIKELPSAADAKKHGKTIEIRDDWTNIRIKVMKELVELKFSQNEDLKEKLLSTNDAELIEGNTWGDTYWGICKGKGENNLGKILMLVRSKLKD